MNVLEAFLKNGKHGDGGKRTQKDGGFSVASLQNVNQNKTCQMSKNKLEVCYLLFLTKYKHL